MLLLIIILLGLCSVVYGLYKALVCDHDYSFYDALDTGRFLKCTKCGKVK